MSEIESKSPFVIYSFTPLPAKENSGLKLYITKGDLDSISDKHNYLLQKKVKYEPIIEAKDGGLVKTEIRMLYVWHENDARPKLLTNLARLSRGEMIGVDFNKNFDWVGGTVGFMEE